MITIPVHPNQSQTTNPPETIATRKNTSNTVQSPNPRTTRTKKKPRAYEKSRTYMHGKKRKRASRVRAHVRPINHNRIATHHTSNDRGTLDGRAHHTEKPLVKTRRGSMKTPCGRRVWGNKRTCILTRRALEIFWATYCELALYSLVIWRRAAAAAASVRPSFWALLSSFPSLLQLENLRSGKLHTRAARTYSGLRIYARARRAIKIFVRKSGIIEVCRGWRASRACNCCVWIVFYGIIGRYWLLWLSVINVVWDLTGDL